MADTTLSQLNPFGQFKVGSLSTMANILLVVFIAVVILALFGFLIYIIFTKKTYYIRIHLFRLVGNVPTRVAIYSAKDVPMGGAGDKLWRVAPSGVWKFKTIKWLSVGKLQTAKNEFWYWLREDGEWINFVPSNIDEISRSMGVKFVQEDMRLQRLATDRLLEQRHMQKSFWDKWQNTIMTVIFFLVICVCMVIIFYQFSKLLDKMMPLIQSLEGNIAVVSKYCGLNSTNPTGLIPA